MARPGAQSTFRLSLLDRFRNCTCQPQTLGTLQGNSLEAIKQSIASDLQWLLNSRQSPSEQWEGSPDLEASLLTFGLPDFTGMNPNHGADQERLRSGIESAIRQFEPRLDRVRVFLQAHLQTERSLHFRISALVRADLVNEAVSFETVLNVGTGSYQWEVWN